MAKTISVTCDGCGKHIENENYQTLTVRRYVGEKHSNVVRIPAFWLCDKCYRQVLMMIPCESEQKLEIKEGNKNGRCQMDQDHH